MPMLSDGQAADCCYRESIQRLARASILAQLTRVAPAVRGVALPAGPPLRRAGAAAHRHQMLEEMGMAAFAERARRELAATGETARKRTAPAARRRGRRRLTAQEAQVAGWPGTACPTRRSAPGCSSARARSSTT